MWIRTMHSRYRGTPRVIGLFVLRRSPVRKPLRWCRDLTDSSIYSFEKGGDHLVPISRGQDVWLACQRGFIPEAIKYAAITKFFFVIIKEMNRRSLRGEYLRMLPC